MADVFRRLEGRSRPVRVGSVAIIGLVALFGVAANIGIAVVPNEEWSSTQVLNYVQTQKTVSDLTGHPLEGNVIRGSSLPEWAPAGKLFVIGNCNGLYISNGENFATVPSEQYQRNTWMTVELGPAFQHAFRVTAGAPQSGATEPVPLVTAGKYTITVSETPTSDPHFVRLNFVAQGPKTYTFARPEVRSGSANAVTVITDPVKHSLQVIANGEAYRGTVVPFTSIHVDSAPASSHALSVTNQTASAAPALCQGILH